MLLWYFESINVDFFWQKKRSNFSGRTKTTADYHSSSFWGGGRAYHRYHNRIYLSLMPQETTGKPEHKRDHIKSQAMSQCRPLPFSSQVQTINQYPSVPSEYMNIHPQIDSDGSISSENRSMIEVQKIGDDNNNRQFQRRIPAIIESNIDDEVDSKLNKHDWRSALKLTNGTLNHPPYFEKEREYGMNVAGNFLQVKDLPSRTHSAEMLLAVPSDEERRRASLDFYQRLTQRRKLPNIEHLQRRQLIE
ncbi:unnamed protein product [Dracunculus medinensis]|uniref:Uncharacterized protein n=1 Tax=Dracunculus medinensis TaxID=318479 RepID=A0A0N4U371_DRAME|nr:unnamed protein product [Dracunculus medinensis]